MKTLGKTFKLTWYREYNPFIRQNHRYDHIVKCPLCQSGFSFLDILQIKGKWGCPFCNRILSYVQNII